MTPGKAFRLFGQLELHKKDSLEFLRAVSERSSEEVRSMLAVRDSISALGAIGENESIEALRSVYFTGGKKLGSGCITRAVNRFAAEAYLDERTVYRRIARAAKIYRSIAEKKRSDIAA